MILVGLWWIQTNPSDRPSMTRVVEMLQGSPQSLQIPPNTFLSSPAEFPQGYLSITSSPPYHESIKIDFNKIKAFMLVKTI